MHASRISPSFASSLLWILALGLAAAGCANGNDGARDAGRRRDAAYPPGVDANVPVDPGEGPCGPAGRACCAGRTCELGLRCGRGDVCCVGPGSPVACSTASDCCTGLTCQGGACCGPRGGSCSGGSDCCGGLVCASGVCRNPEIDDIDGPGPGGPGDGASCGGVGGSCCPGFTCRSGNVCDSATGRCVACGDAGQRCCDGASACTRPTLSCDGTNCVEITDPAYACGEIDQPCCDASGRPGGTDCTGDLVCSAGGRCIRRTDTGGTGEPCSPRGSCDPGLMCDHSTSSCAETPSDCGHDMQMCCDTNADSQPDSCEGSQSCQFGTCSSCRGPSLSCLLDGVPILGGGGCCNGSVCRPAPIVPRCCAGADASCTNSTDCCGFMQCVSGKCQTGREHSFCTDSSECGEGLVCKWFMCQREDEGSTGEGGSGDDCTTNADCGTGLTCRDFKCTDGSMACTEPGAACTSGSSCCDGLACSPAPVEGEATTPPPDRCCAAAGSSCTGHYDCCGEMLCADGQCQCQARNALCYSDQDCCEGDGCIGGNCVDVSMCRRPGQSCTSILDCCGSQTCAPTSFGATVKHCGLLEGERCQDASQCVGLQECRNGECQCRRERESCASSFDCCGSLACVDGSCANVGTP